MLITDADLSDPRLIALLTTHLHQARSQTGPDSAHALDLDGLRAPDIRVWALWDEDTLVGVGALKRLSADHGEVKSMHVAQAFRGAGAGGIILRHIIAAAKAQGLNRLSLETGSWPFFEPAWRLYRTHGFIDCPPFGDYKPDPNSVFMTQVLTDA